jgi:hypothetical protein
MIHGAAKNQVTWLESWAALIGAFCLIWQMTQQFSAIRSLPTHLKMNNPTKRWKEASSWEQTKRDDTGRKFSIGEPSFTALWIYMHSTAPWPQRVVKRNEQGRANRCYSMTPEKISRKPHGNN